MNIYRRKLSDRSRESSSSSVLSLRSLKDKFRKRFSLQERYTPWQESPFPYRQLDVDRREVRLLTLHPAEFDSPVSCSIHVCSLDDKPAYNALSYVWGDPAETVPITVDGSTI